MKLSRKSINKLLALPNVNGVYTGRQYKNGKYIGTGIVVMVERKVSTEELKSSELVPRTVEGHDTDVQEGGEIKALGRTDRNRPFRMGDSTGIYFITAGTIGWQVQRNGETFLLSNNHVFAGVNKGKTGDPILQPGTYDGGTVANSKIGTLHSYVQILFEGDTCVISSAITKLLNVIARLVSSGVRFGYTLSSKTSAITNTVDCALASIDNPRDASTEVYELGDISSGNLKIVGLLFAGSDQITIANKIRNVATMLDVTVPNSDNGVEIGDIVWKSGRTTGVTSGEIVGTDFTGKVNMGDEKIAVFTDQLLIGTPGFSAGGDSGSAIVRKSTSVEK